MKKVALFFLMLVFTCSAIGYSTGDEEKPKSEVVQLNLDKARENLGLARQLYHQETEVLLKDQRKIIVQTITYKDRTYKVNGTYSQWKQFFEEKEKETGLRASNSFHSLIY